MEHHPTWNMPPIIPIYFSELEPQGLYEERCSMSGVVISLHIQAETKWPSFSGHVKYIFLNENMWISIKMPLKFVP